MLSLSKRILRGLHLYSQPCRLCHGRWCQEGRVDCDVIKITITLIKIIISSIRMRFATEIIFKGEDRSLSADYEDLDADYDDEDLEEVDEQDDLTEYDRDTDFWDNIMGIEEDKKTQVRF